jgi:hypothetical protein
MISRLLFTIIFIGILINSAHSQGENTFQLVKANTINTSLANQFPINKSFQGHSAIFSQPKILIDVLDQSIKLQMTASANQAQQQLITTLVFEGKMTYDEFSESYIFEDLQLDSFKVVEDSFSDSQHIIKAIKQSLINDFEDLVLFNLTELNSIAPTRQADEIEISKQQLRFIWK